jgi:hypothetical protein
MSWDVTGTVASWFYGTSPTPNYGFLLKRNLETLGASGPRAPSRTYPEPSLQPKLDITYAADGVTLLSPDTLHSNGAELKWTRYVGESGAPFERYEVHRSPTPRFTPSSATLLAVITNTDTTSYTDTTAAPLKTFTYKVVANTSPSNERTVTLPVDGQARKVLQPDSGTGKALYITQFDQQPDLCANYGAADSLKVGVHPEFVYRSLSLTT